MTKEVATLFRITGLTFIGIGVSTLIIAVEDFSYRKRLEKHISTMDRITVANTEHIKYIFEKLAEKEEIR